MSDCCFGVATCQDGSISIAAVDGADVSVKHFEPAQADSSSLVKFVGDRGSSPRICIASTGAWALGLALALGALLSVWKHKPTHFDRGRNNGL